MAGVKSIYEIEVNDAAFDKFYDKFKEYEGKFGGINDDWSKTAKIAEGVGLGLLGVLGVLSEQHKKQKAINEEQEREKKRQKEILELEQKRQREMEKMLRSSVTFAKNMAGVTLDVLKWVGFGGLLGSVLGGFGLDRLAQSASDMRRAGQGYGVTPGQLVGLKASFSPYADVEGSLEKIANAQRDPREQPWFHQFGIMHPEQYSVEQLFRMMLKRIGPMFNAIGQNPLLAGPQGRHYTDFFDLDTMRRMGGLARDHPAEFAQVEAEYRGRQKELVVIDAAMQKMQHLSVTIEYAKATIELSLIKAIEKLAGPQGFDGLIDSITKTITTFLGSDGFTKMIKNAQDVLAKFVSYLQSDQFKQNVQMFISDMGQLADWTHQELVRLGIVAPSTPDEKAEAAWNAQDTAKQNPFQAGPGQPGVKGQLMDAFAAVFPGMSGKDTETRQKEAMADLRAFGLGNPNSTAATMGNITGENDTFDPFRFGDHGHSFGLFQWNDKSKDRRAAYKTMFGHEMDDLAYWKTRGKDAWKQAMAEQLKFYSWEAEGKIEGGKYAVPGLAEGTRGYGALTHDIVTHFERSKNQTGPRGDIAIRTRAAHDFFVIISHPPGTDAAVSGRQAAGAGGSG